MALELLIKGVDRIGYLEHESLRINQDAATYVSTCNLNLIDPNNVVTAAVKDPIIVRDVALGVVYFDGTVANVDYNPIGGGTSPRRRVKLQCQDNNILVEEAIVVGPHSYVAVADIVIIAALFAAYLPAFDAATNVNGVDGAVTIDFQNITLREAMKQLCDRTGGFWFVRAAALYYGVEADFGLVPWDLSDTPNNVTSFGYLHDTARKFHGSNMVNEITVIGILAAAGGVTRQDAVSIFIYGTHAAITTDNRISTVAGATKRGDAILADWSMPRESYTVKTFPGTRTPAIAGQRIRYINSVYGINAVYTIRRLSISFPADTALYTMALGDDLDLGLLGQRIFLDKIEEALEPITPADLPLSAQGWSHDIEFLSTDFDTVRWTGGTITAADGTAFGIGPGTTGDMNAVTARYVYLDLAISAVLLQWNDAVANAVGANRLLIAVCWPSADAVLEAVFQVFGGASTDAGVFINADNIAANCITANEMHANSIQAGHIVAGAVTTIKLDALAVTTAKLAAGAVTADKLQIGGMFFDDANGLFLLGPHCYIDTSEWRSLRQQSAVLTGAFHQVAGRWIDTRALVIEEASKNWVVYPNFELGLMTGWANYGADPAAASTDRARHGSYSAKCTPVVQLSGIRRDETSVAGLAGTFTISCWVWVENLDDPPKLTGRIYYTDATFTGFPTDTCVTSKYGRWQRLTVTQTAVIPGGETLDYIRIYIYTNAATGTWYIDDIQLENLSYATTYLDGSLGSGYAWVGATNASTSTRTATKVELDDNTGIFFGVDQISYRFVVQASEDAVDIVNISYLSEAILPAEIVAARFDAATNRFKVYLSDGVDNNAWALQSSAQTFAQGDWIDIVVTLDYNAAGAGDYNIYIDGVLDGTDATANIAAPTNITDWALGSRFNTTFHWNGAICEFSVFEKVLTAIEIAQLYNLQRPVIDAGASETPGIYIIDGKFRIASSTSGNRIEIVADEIAGYDSAGVKQFYLQASDGKAVAGAGQVILDASGVTIAAADAATSRIKWDVAGATISRIGAFQFGGHNYLWLQGDIPTANTISNYIELNARAFGVLDEARIELRSERLGTTGRITIQVVGSVALVLESGYVKVQEDVRIGGGLYVGSTAVNPDIDDIWCDGEVSTDGGANRWDLGTHGAAADGPSTGLVNIWINGVLRRLMVR